MKPIAFWLRAFLIGALVIVQAILGGVAFGQESPTGRDGASGPSGGAPGQGPDAPPTSGDSTLDFSQLQKAAPPAPQPAATQAKPQTRPAAPRAAPRSSVPGAQTQRASGGSDELEETVSEQEQPVDGSLPKVTVSLGKAPSPLSNGGGADPVDADLTRRIGSSCTGLCDLAAKPVFWVGMALFGLGILLIVFSDRLTGGRARLSKPVAAGPGRRSVEGGRPRSAGLPPG